MKRMIVVTLCIMILFAGCMPVDKQYYAEQSHYVTVAGTVCHIMYDEGQSALYFDLEKCPEGFSDVSFKLVGQGFLIARENGIVEALNLGDEVTFICAPRYFGDGYVVPITAISVGGKCFLDFDQGYDGLMNWLE